MLIKDLPLIVDQISNIQKISKRKSCVYFCLFGPYDAIEPPKFIEKDFDYFILTDQDLALKHFNIIKVDTKGSNRRANRYFKINPHLFFKPYSTSIYLDSNVIIHGSLKLLQEVDCCADLIIFQHNKRNCVYDEINECIKWKRDSTRILRQHRKTLRREGIKKKSGLLLGSILVRRHNNLVSFSSTWWSKYAAGSSRDQISLIQALNVHSPNIFILPFGNFQKYFTRKSHKQKDITERNLNFYEKTQLVIIQKLFEIYKWIKAL